MNNNYVSLISDNIFDIIMFPNIETLRFDCKHLYNNSNLCEVFKKQLPMLKELVLVNYDWTTFYPAPEVYQFASEQAESFVKSVIQLDYYEDDWISIDAEKGAITYKHRDNSICEETLALEVAKFIPYKTHIIKHK